MEYDFLTIVTQHLFGHYSERWHTLYTNGASRSFTGFDICDQSIRHSDQRRRQAFTYLKGSGPNTEHILRFVCATFSVECYQASSADPCYIKLLEVILLLWQRGKLEVLM